MLWFMTLHLSSSSFVLLGTTAIFPPLSFFASQTVVGPISLRLFYFLASPQTASWFLDVLNPAPVKTWHTKMYLRRKPARLWAVLRVDSKLQLIVLDMQCSISHYQENPPLLVQSPTLLKTSGEWQSWGRQECTSGTNMLRRRVKKQGEDGGV